MRWLNSITDSMHMSSSKLREIVKVSEAWRSAARGVTKSRTRLSNDKAGPGTVPCLVQWEGGNSEWQAERS